MALRCNPISGHQTLYWYQQFPGQGLGLLVRFENEEAVDDSQLPKNRFSALRPEGTDSTLKILRAELGDSAVYFCASSSTTASQRCFLPVQETPGFSSPAPLPASQAFSHSSHMGKKRVCRDKLGFVRREHVNYFLKHQG